MLSMALELLRGSFRISAVSTFPNPIRSKNWFWRDLLLRNSSKSENITPTDTCRVPRKHSLSAVAVPSSVGPILNLSPSTFPPSNHVKSQTLTAGEGNWENRSALIELHLVIFSDIRSEGLSSRKVLLQMPKNRESHTDPLSAQLLRDVQNNC